jgi:hypothetical protein
MKYTPNYLSLTLILSAVLLLNSCELLKEEETPTKTRMIGTWEVVEAYNEKDDSIIKQISFPTTVFNLGSDNSVVSTAGPMFMYIVYGGSKYTEIASKIGQVFKYVEMDFNNGGEWFIKNDGVVNKFTIEMKLEGLPGQSAFKDILSLLGVKSSFLDITIYHKFTDIYVNMIDDETMEWRFTYDTFAEYNTKDEYGKYVLWNGISTNSFSKCSFILKKRTQGLKEIVAAKKK